MADAFHPLSAEHLTAWVFDELEAKGSIFGLPDALFYAPRGDDPFRLALYGSELETPFGVAAGPHSQLAQNIIVAWLCGARFIELKTVQTLDRIDVPRPCIDMQDEGYNVEWSQELRIEESLAEYVNAWVLVHALHRRLGFAGEAPGVVFNMSVGYDLEGIRRPNMQGFLRSMADSRRLRDVAVAAVARRFPEVESIEIPARVTNNVTLSTMHGCPPDEIGKISHYLMTEWGLHTTVKLNPTLLGPERLRHILNDRLGYGHVEVPDSAFEHDIKYPDAVDLMRQLQATADRTGVLFGAKLSNTLEVVNSGRVFPARDETMYLSGRPLHALTVNLARDLARELDGRLLMSFAGGADAFNAPRLLAGGMRTVTSCSDLLRPGGYTRMLQYMDCTREAMAAAGARTLEELICAAAADSLPGFAGEPGDEGDEGDDGRVAACALRNLDRYADAVLDDPLVHQATFDRSRTKTSRALGPFDCIQAPCTDRCSVDQKVPRYMRAVREDDLEAAIRIAREDNPMPAILGRACTHPCESVCLRTHYDDPLAIREVKRFIMDHERPPARVHGDCIERAAVAVIGGGPCGLTVAYFLSRAGYRVTIFEKRSHTGGMVSGAIPGFRAAPDAVDADLAAIASLGATVDLGVEVGRDVTIADLRRRGFRYLVIAAGAQKGVRLGIDGEDCPGAVDGLDFLRETRRGQAPPVGSRVGVIGGGDVAIDCARTARRLGADEVSIIYRRTTAEMPAQAEELAAVAEEGIGIVELTVPRRVVVKDGRLAALRCARTRLGEPDASGRRRPVEVPGSEVEMPLDTLIVAIGQRADLSFLESEAVELTPTGYIKVDPDTMETSADGVFAGGDVVLDGPATIVEACGDGRRIAATIRRREEGSEAAVPAPRAPDLPELLLRRSRRQRRVAVPHSPCEERSGFAEIITTLEPDAARREASRCLDCDLLCSTCASVCPNRAIFTYSVTPGGLELPLVRLVDGGGWRVEGTRHHRIDQRFQVAVLAALCNECGNCTTFCPTSGAPYRDKPRLYLDRDHLESQTNNAFMVCRDGDRWALLARVDSATHELVDGSVVRYTSATAEVDLDPHTLAVVGARPSDRRQPGGLVPMDICATMITLLRAVRSSMPELPAAPAAASGALLAAAAEGSGDGGSSPRNAGGRS